MSALKTRLFAAQLLGTRSALEALRNALYKSNTPPLPLPHTSSPPPLTPTPAAAATATTTVTTSNEQNTPTMPRNCLLNGPLVYLHNKT